MRHFKLIAIVVTAILALLSVNGEHSTTVEASVAPVVTGPGLDELRRVGEIQHAQIIEAQYQQELAERVAAAAKYRAEQDRQEALERARAAARANRGAPRHGAPLYGQPSGDVWDCITRHESGGNYHSVNGNGHYGKYQFSQTTWNGTAKRHGRGDLVNVRPDNASPADQDQMARWLQADSGWGQWSTHSKCGV